MQDTHCIKTARNNLYTIEELGISWEPNFGSYTSLLTVEVIDKLDVYSCSVFHFLVCNQFIIYVTAIIGVGRQGQINTK